MLPTPFQCSTAPIRKIRAITLDVNLFLHNLMFQYTNPLHFETEPHSIYTILFLRGHLLSYLYYIRYPITSTISSRSLTLLKMLPQEHTIGQNIHKTYN